MTKYLSSVENYDPLLEGLNFDSVVSGKTTAKLELTEGGEFVKKIQCQLMKKLYQKG